MGKEKAFVFSRPRTVTEIFSLLLATVRNTT
jgi:hypothetical protein